MCCVALKTHFKVDAGLPEDARVRVDHDFVFGVRILIRLEHGAVEEFKLCRHNLRVLFLRKNNNNRASQARTLIKY